MWCVCVGVWAYVCFRSCVNTCVSFVRYGVGVLVAEIEGKRRKRCSVNGDYVHAKITSFVVGCLERALEVAWLCR